MARSTEIRPRTIVDPRASTLPEHAGIQWLIVVFVAILALNGLAIAYQAIAGGLATARSGESRTTFGSLAVTGVEAVGGLSASDVAG